MDADDSVVEKIEERDRKLSPDRLTNMTNVMSPPHALNLDRNYGVGSTGSWNLLSSAGAKQYA